MQTAIYARVSTDEQTTDNQVIKLKQVAERNGWDVQAIYADTISGAKSKRPDLDKLMKSVMRKEIVLGWQQVLVCKESQSLLLNGIKSSSPNCNIGRQSSKRL